ncbi:hypothetical protein [Albibacterium profundi]|uniref:Uncharacterized protein n=1 Tax=Albibacterium profundi TaxID=3134906 RepID=A0ABV5C9M5_9SPHI
MIAFGFLPGPQNFVWKYPFEGVKIDDYFDKMNGTFHDYYFDLFGDKSRESDITTRDLFPDDAIIKSVVVPSYTVFIDNDDLTDVSLNSNDLICAA